MKKQLPTQLTVGLAILLIGGFLVGGEYLLVKWYPGHKQRVADEVLALKPYQNAQMGVDMQIAAGIYGKVEPFPGGVKISRSKFMSIGPSITLTTQPNPDKTFEFTPELLAKWQVRGTYEEIPRYTFEHTKIQNRDAVLIWLQKDRMMHLYAHIMSPDRIVEADCTPGKADEALYLQACAESLRTINVAGPEPPPENSSQGIVELNPKKK
jgi:hypothetical protein